MKPKTFRLAVLTVFSVGSVLSAFAQGTIYEQSRIGSTTVGTNNVDFTLNGFSSTPSGNKSTAPGLPGTSTSVRFVATPAHITNYCTISPNNTIAGQLVNGTSYNVAITYATSGTSGQAEPTDIVVSNSDTLTSGNDTFVTATSGIFKSGNQNTWVSAGNVTIGGALPTFTFTWQGGTNVNRWYIDSVRFTPLAPGPTAQYWNTGSPGGNGTWNTSLPNWNTSSTGSGTQGIYTQADLADFNGAAGTVTIDPINGITTDGGLEFDTTGYTIQSGPLTLGLGTNIAVVGSGTTATINSVITGVNGMATTGLGTLIINNTNNLTGTVTLSAGTLQLGTNETFTSLAGNSSGILALTTNTLTVGDASSNAYIGAISDSGSATPGFLIKQGSGILNLSGTSTFHGTTTVNAGALTIASDAALGTAPATAVANQITLNNGSRLDFSTALTLSATRGITLGAGGGQLSSSGTGITPSVPANITGPGSLSIPSGGFDLGGTNTFAGNLIITGNTVDTGGNNLASIRFSSSAAGGLGRIIVAPTNTAINVTLRTFTATNVVVTNPVEFDTGGIFLSGAIASSKVCTIAFTGNINGTNSVTIGNPAAEESNPGGTVILSGNNSAWSGASTLQVGSLGVGSPTALGSGGFGLVPTSSSNIILFATTPLTGANALTNPVAINSFGGGIIFGGSNSFELAGPAALYGYTTITVSNTGASILSGSLGDSVSGSGDQLVTVGPGTLTLSGSNTYDGGTIITSGALKVNNTTGSGAGSNFVTVQSPGTFGGSGGIMGTVDLSGTLSPGATGPGMLTTSNETWEGNSSYTWDINKAGGSAGANPGWSQANINGTLTINANSGSPCTINLTSLTLANAPGNVSDFSNSRNYSWSIAHTTSGITGFDPTAFVLNTAGFSNSLGSGSFSITNNSTDVLLVFTTPISAPSIGSIQVSGTSLTITGSGGTPSAEYRVLGSTNVAAHLATWTPVGTNSFDGSGNFTFNGTVSSTNRLQFFVIVSP